MTNQQQLVVKDTVKYCSIQSVPSGLEEAKTRPEQENTKIQEQTAAEKFEQVQRANVVRTLVTSRALLVDEPRTVCFVGGCTRNQRLYYVALALEVGSQRITHLESTEGNNLLVGRQNQTCLFH